MRKRGFGLIIITCIVVWFALSWADESSETVGLSADMSIADAGAVSFTPVQGSFEADAPQEALSDESPKEAVSFVTSNLSPKESEYFGTQEKSDFSGYIPVDVTLETTPYSDAGGALQSLLAGNPSQVISFGESHPFSVSSASSALQFSDSTEKSSLQYFNTELLPVLVQNGYTDFVIEYFIKDTPQEEFDYYFQNGRLDPNSDLDNNATPYLNQAYADARDQPGFIQILDNVRNLKAAGYDITLHGGFADKDAVDQFMDRKIDHPELQNEIGKATLEQVEMLLAEGKKVVTYNGAAHIKIVDPKDPDSPTEEEENMREKSFGDELSANSNINWLPIRLVDPESLLSIASWLSGENYAKYKPKSGTGVTLVNEGIQKAIVFADENPSSIPSQ